MIRIDNTVGTPNGTGWMSSFDFSKISQWNGKYLLFCLNGSRFKDHGFNFDKFHYQWSAASEPPVGGVAIEVNINGDLWWFRFLNGMVWDLPADRNHANFSANTIIDMKNCHLTRIGGSASAMVNMDDVINHRRGVFTRQWWCSILHDSTWHGNNTHKSIHNPTISQCRIRLCLMYHQRM